MHDHYRLLNGQRIEIERNVLALQSATGVEKEQMEKAKSLDPLVRAEFAQLQRAVGWPIYPVHFEVARCKWKIFDIIDASASQCRKISVVLQFWPQDTATPSRFLVNYTNKIAGIVDQDSVVRIVVEPATVDALRKSFITIGYKLIGL